MNTCRKLLALAAGFVVAGTFALAEGVRAQAGVAGEDDDARAALPAESPMATQFAFSLVADQTAPGAKAEVLLTVKPEGGYTAELSATSLPAPKSLASDATTYVVWLYHPATHEKERVAALPPNARSGTVSFDVGGQDFAVVVTAEPTDQPEEWSAIAVLTGQPALPKPSVQPVQEMAGLGRELKTPAPPAGVEAGEAGGQPRRGGEAPTADDAPTADEAPAAGEPREGHEARPGEGAQPDEAAARVESEERRERDAPTTDVETMAPAPHVTVRMELKGSARARAARGELEVDSDGTVRLTAKKLPSLSALGAGLNAFLVWAVDPANGRSQPLGALESAGDGAWTFIGSGLQPGMAVVITAEPGPHAALRSGPVVLSGRSEED